MKPLYSTILALLAAASGAFAQTSASTTPVGYLTLAAPATADTNFSIPLQTASVWAGVSTGVSGDVISVAASTFTASQYVYVSGTQPNTYLLQPTSGALQGRQLKVTANGTGSVTVDPGGSNDVQTQGFVSGDTFVIRPYWTLKTLFPGGAGLGSTSDITNPTTVLFVTDNSTTNVNRSTSASYSYDDGSDTGLAGWYDINSYTLSDDVVLDPSTVFTAHNSLGTALSLVVSGSVPATQVATLVVTDTQPNDNNIQLSFPVDTSLAQSHLFESGAVTATSDITNPLDVVMVFDPTAASYNPSSSATYAYDDGTDTGLAGWYDVNSYSLSTGNVLKAGSIIIIRKGAGGSLTATPWIAPLPYTL
jgi:uncharacterized protein (TIGR02597 family)